MVRTFNPDRDGCTHVVANLEYLLLINPTCGAGDGCGVDADVVDGVGCSG